jgi:putative ABC transport system substrate-binding protein
MNRIDRRRLLIAAGAFAALPITGMAQQPGKTWRIGFLAGAGRPQNGLPPVPLRAGLADLGYAEGSNVVYEGRWAEGRFDRFPALAEELVKLRVDAIVVIGWVATRAVKRATSTIPIVIAGVGDAVESGLATSLARPGANLTGMSDMEAELSSKRLQLLKETVPKAARMAVLWNQDDLGMTLRYRNIDAAARSLGVAVQALGVREPDDFEVAFSAMKRERPDALFLVTDALTNLNRKRVIEFAAAHRIPAMYENGTYVRDGGLMSYGSNIEDGLRRAAYYVDRILKGAKPGELPMEQPTRYYLVVNLKTAKTLGLTFPASVVLRADNVVE